MIAAFQLLSWWRVATGAGNYGSLDSRCARDPLGLPVIPGRQVKGLFREAVRKAEQLKRVPAGRCVSLFGTRALPGQPLQDEPQAGTVRFGDARLPFQDRNALKGHDDLIVQLFGTRSATAIASSGVARSHSLRVDEVALPVTLFTEIVGLEGAPSDWTDTLALAAPLIRAVGSGRTRGLGRTIVKLEALDHA